MCRHAGRLLASVRARSGLLLLCMLVLTGALAGAGARVAGASDYHGTITPGGSSVAVTLSSSGDNGYLTFSASAGDRVFLKAQAGSYGGAGAYTLSLQSPGGATLDSTFMFSSALRFFDTMTLASTGTYTIQLAPYHDTTGTTTITLYSVAADASASITPGGSSVGETLAVGQNAGLTWSGTAGDRVFLKAVNGTLSSATTPSVGVSIRK